MNEGIHPVLGLTLIWLISFCVMHIGEQGTAVHSVALIVAICGFCLVAFIGVAWAFLTLKDRL